MNASISQPVSQPILEMIETDVGLWRNPAITALERVSWQVNPGDYWFVGGLHRSGKSDLIMAAAALIPPRGGTVKLFGLEPRQLPPEKMQSLRKRIGVVFDGGQLLHHLSIGENVALPIGYHHNLSLDRAMIEIGPLLQLTELNPWEAFYPAAVSRNWQQRAGLARALALQPELLVLDNPLSGLDPQDARWWLNVLRDLRSGHPLLGGKQLTLIVTGDSFEIWKNHAEQFAVLKDKGFHVLQSRPGLSADEQALLKPLLPGDEGKP